MSRLMFWKSGVWSASGRPFPLESVTIRTFGRLVLLLLTPEEGCPLFDGVDLPSSLLWYMSLSDTVPNVREDNVGLVNIIIQYAAFWCVDRRIGVQIVKDVVLWGDVYPHELWKLLVWLSQGVILRCERCTQMWQIGNKKLGIAINAIRNNST